MSITSGSLEWELNSQVEEAMPGKRIRLAMESVERSVQPTCRLYKFERKRQEHIGRHQARIQADPSPGVAPIGPSMNRPLVQNRLLHKRSVNQGTRRERQPDRQA